MENELTFWKFSLLLWYYGDQSEMSLGRDGKLKAHIWGKSTSKKAKSKDISFLTWIQFVEFLSPHCLQKQEPLIWDLILNPRECHNINLKMSDLDICIACSRFLKRFGDFQLRWTFRFRPKTKLCDFWDPQNVREPTFEKCHTLALTLCLYAPQEFLTEMPFMVTTMILDFVGRGDCNDLDDNGGLSRLSFLWREKRSSEVSSCQRVRGQLDQPKRQHTTLFKKWPSGGWLYAPKCVKPVVSAWSHRSNISISISWYLTSSSSSSYCWCAEAADTLKR